MELFQFLDQQIKNNNLDNRGRVPSELYCEKSPIVIPMRTMYTNTKTKKQLFDICLDKKIDIVEAVIIKGIDYPSTWITAKLIDKRLQIFCNIKLRSSEILLFGVPPY